MIRKIGRFSHIAKVIRYYRLRSCLTQEKVSEIIGYQNSQYISNVERGLCTIPAKRISKLCDALNITNINDVVDAIVNDYRENIVRKL